MTNSSPPTPCLPYAQGAYVSEVRDVRQREDARSMMRAQHGGSHEMLTAVSVFSGAGGLDLGAYRLGVEIVLATDILPEAAAAHKTLIPGDGEFVVAPIQELDTLPRADVLLGGYPCQPFSMGGPRRPAVDNRSTLFREFARAIDLVRPKFFVAENVPGLHSLAGRSVLEEHLAAFRDTADGYRITYHVLKAEEFGVPQRRRRLFVIGVRSDLGVWFQFPEPDHTEDGRDGTKMFRAHGDVIGGLPAWPIGEFYERPHDPDGEWPWYYMSRNRRAHWDAPSYTILANARHTPIHPGSTKMVKVWSELSDGYKQGWEFSPEHDHLDVHSHRTKLEQPRRLSWREASRIQTFPDEFEPPGSLGRKFELIGNAVPPLLSEVVLSGIVDNSGLGERPPSLAHQGTVFRAEETSGSSGRKRSAARRTNRAGDSDPAVRLRGELHGLGLRFRKNLRIRWSGGYVKADAVLVTPRIVVLLNRCLWHGCPQHGLRPSDVTGYWKNRLDANIRNDRAVDSELAQLGWIVARVWEHESPSTAARRIREMDARERERWREPD